MPVDVSQLAQGQLDATAAAARDILHANLHVDNVSRVIASRLRAMSHVMRARSSNHDAKENMNAGHGNEHQRTWVPRRWLPDNRALCLPGAAGVYHQLRPQSSMQVPLLQPKQQEQEDVQCPIPRYFLHLI